MCYSEKGDTMRKDQEQKNIFHSKEVVFLIVITCIVSIGMGMAIQSRFKYRFVSEPENELIEKFKQNYQYIKDNYYEDVDDNTLLNGAIKGMLSSLEDPFSIFIDNEESADFNMSLNGNYQGIGVSVKNEGDYIVIVSVMSDSPAEEAGLQNGDIIKSVDDKNFIGQDKSELTSYIKESKNKIFEFVIVRDGNEQKFTLKRDTVTIPSVASELFERDQKKIGYIYFNIFSNTTYEQFQKHLQELENKGMQSLIIDVRENSGGHLTTAINILSLFLDSKQVIYQIEKKGEVVKYYSTGQEKKTYPIVVLQNENSASASELLSAAFQESYGATIIGETSYGKGTVQELVGLDNGNEYKFTTKKWLTPKGNWINKVGVTPDIEISLEDNYYENPSNETDTQLQRAIEYLLQ